MGKRKFSLSVHRKNEERKRWGFYPIRIPLNKVSVLNVSIPLDLLSFQVSLPISIVKDSAASSIATLRARFASVGSLPAGWIDVTEQADVSREIVYCRLETKQPMLVTGVSHCIHIQDDFHWRFVCHGRQVLPAKCPLLTTLRSILSMIVHKAYINT